ncbi:MAG: hypothetical protein LBT96_04210 [Campylobacteraceae bacterium]|jgi:hypothetical protein|nr:hypothetical protein [Campylobacteraceae bacterium]
MKEFWKALILSYKYKVNVLVNADKYKNRSIKTSYGEDNLDKTFYIIRIPQDDMGLFSIILTNLTHITYAIKNRYVPVIDLKTVKTILRGRTSGIAGGVFYERWF